MSSPAGWYYHELSKRGVATYWGPFPDKLTCEMAAYFHRPVQERDAAAGRHGGLRAYLGQGVGSYDDGEVDAVIRDPGGFNYKKGLRKSAEKLSMHESWKEFPLDFRSHLFLKDYEAR